MNRSPLISVCIAVYNRARFIEAAIESVLKQTYQNFEIIIIDDGSTDDTVNKIACIEDKRIHLFINDKNRGVVYTRNRYLELAKGEFIAILDSDDLWMPSKLEKQLTFFSSHHEYAICGTLARREYSDGSSDLWKFPSTDTGIRARLLWGSAMVHSSVMVRKQLMLDYNIKYDNAIRQAEDYDFIRQFVFRAKAYNIGEVLTRYAVHQEQFTSQAKEEQVNESIKVAYRYCKDLGINISEEEAKCFEKVYSFKFNLSIKELKILKYFFLNILEIQKDTFIAQKLKENISQKWFLSCYKSSTNGLGVFKLYINNKNLKTRPIFSIIHLKFFIKCLLRKN